MRTEHRKRFTMAMVTDPQNQFSRFRDPNMYETYEHKKGDTFKTGTEKHYDDYGHRPNTQIKTMQKSTYLLNNEHLKMMTYSQLGTKKVYDGYCHPTHK